MPIPIDSGFACNVYTSVARLLANCTYFRAFSQNGSPIPDISFAVKNESVTKKRPPTNNTVATATSS